VVLDAQQRLFRLNPSQPAISTGFGRQPAISA
jgi:hypothetical protein